MRPKVLLLALSVAGLVIAAGVWGSRVLGRAGTVAPAITQVSLPRSFDQPPVSTPPPGAKPPSSAQSISALRASGRSATTPNTAEEQILADLQKSDRETQQAALRRAREAGDSAIVPRLREAAARMDDAREKADILDTIDFLNLPDLADNVEAARAARAEAGLPDLPQSPTNRWTGRPFVRKD